MRMRVAVRAGLLALVFGVVGLAGCASATSGSSGGSGGGSAPTANAGGPYTGTAGTAVAFSSAGSSDPQGQALTYSWNFGDNSTATGVSPTHVYSATGTFTVSLTVTDTSGLSGTATGKTTIVAGLPIANAGGPYTGMVGSAVSFFGAGSSDPQGQALMYAWNFGDGSTGTTANPTHTYSAPGTFTATLTVTDTSSLSNTITTKATIAPAPPLANLGGPYQGILGVAINFSASASSDPQGETLTYAWDFGDGTTASGVSANHTYSALGTYTAKLTVTNTSNLSNTATVSVIVPNGRAFAAQKALSGSHVYLFAANTTGYGGMGLAPSSANVSVSLLSAASTGQSDSLGGYVLTGADGSFFIAGDYSCTPGSQVYLYALGGSTGAGTNTGIGLLSALGACPSGGNFAATPYIVMNEVSTIATAYSFAGFATDATHVSSSGTALAQVGIKNAFANVPNLETLGTGVALATTPAGNGTVPQAEINTLADILVSCTGTGSAGSNGCALLLGNALLRGVTGTPPTDTATAAINISHNPGANVSPLYALAAGKTQFVPALGTQPNDFTVALSFVAGGISSPFGIAVDASGNVWFTNSFQTSSIAYNVTELSSSGTAISPSSGFLGGGLNQPLNIAIDLTGNSWVADRGGIGNSEFSRSGLALSPGTGFGGGGTNYPTGVAIDGLNNVWFSNTFGCVTEFAKSGSAISPSTGFGCGSFNEPFGLAVDGSGSVWVVDGGSSPGTGKSVTKLSHSGSALSPGSGFTGGGLDDPRYDAIDSFGNVWITNTSSFGSSNTPSLSKFSNTGTPLSPSTGFTGGGLKQPYGIAIDGGGNIWVTNTGAYDISEFSNSGAPISPATGFTGYQVAGPYDAGIAVDGSGNVWVANSGYNNVSEFLGAATPVKTPLAASLPATPTTDGSCQLGTRP
jgi:PKD repeat protein